MKNILLGAILGLVASLITWWITQQYIDYKDTKKVASVLLTEVEDNYAICQLVAQFGEKLKAGDKNVTKLAQQRILPPGDFRTTVFMATISQQGILPKEILSRLHYIYYKLGRKGVGSLKIRIQ